MDHMIDLRKVNPAAKAFPEERAGIRHIRLNDPEEIERLWEIEQNEIVARFVENRCESIEEIAVFSANEKDYLVLAVEGKEGHVEDREVGKLQGWLAFTQPGKSQLLRLKKKDVGDLIQDGLRVLEVGFARHPKAKAGQIASALRQAVGLLLDVHEQQGYRLVITAYTDEDNEASRRVLVAAGFLQAGKIKYHAKNKTEDHFFILKK